MSQPQPKAPSSPGGQNRPLARTLVLAFAAIGLIVGFAATARLAAVVAATPTTRWLAQDYRLIDPSLQVGAATEAWAEQLARVISDPGLLRARLAPCLVRTTNANLADAKRTECLAVIDDALRAAPSTSELWLFRATTLARGSDFGEETQTALRNSYRTGPREGWVASGRVVLGLRIWFFLAPDLQDHVRNDLALVLQNNLAAPLARAYVGDPAMRRAAMPALQSLPKDLMDRFVWASRDALNPSLAPG